MSANRYRDHLFVLFEDDAYRQLANGFLLEVDERKIHKIHIVPEAGGWLNVCEKFEKEHIPEMLRYSHRYLVLLLDFDNDPSRPGDIQKRIPDELKNRVFLLGVQSEPEELKQAGLGSFETIGRKMAKECRDGGQDIWAHKILQQNRNELHRLREAVCNFLF